MYLNMVSIQSYNLYNECGSAKQIQILKKKIDFVSKSINSNAPAGFIVILWRSKKEWMNGNK